MDEESFGEKIDLDAEVEKKETVRSITERSSLQENFSDKVSDSEISRRNFLKTLGLIGGGIVAGSVALSSPRILDVGEIDQHEEKVEKPSSPATGRATTIDSTGGTGSAYTAQEHTIEFDADGNEPVNYYFKVGSSTVESVGGGSSDEGTNEEKEDHSHDIPDEGPVTIHGITFENVVNAKEDLGMDNEGNSTVDGDFEYMDNTLIKFPPGKYVWDERHDGFNLENFGMIGMGEKREDVQFLPMQNSTQQVFNIKSGKNVLIENLAFNQRENKRGGIGNTIHLEDNMQLHRLRHMGYGTNQDQGCTTFLQPHITTEDGTGVINDYRMIMSGFSWADYPGNCGSMYTGPAHKGTLTCKNIEATNCSGFYMSRCPGGVIFENSKFDTVNRYALRLGGEGSVIRNTEIIVDPVAKDDYYEFNMGVRWESGFQGFSGGLIEDCEFVCKSVEDIMAPLIEHEADVGELTVRNTVLRHEADGNKPIIRSAKPGASTSIDGTPDKPWSLNLENVTITGSSGGNEPVIDIIGRHGSKIENSCINMQNRPIGIRFSEANLCSVSDSTVNVDGSAVVGDASQSNIDTNGTC